MNTTLKFRLSCLATIVLVAACAGARGFNPSAMTPQRIAQIRGLNISPRAACPVAYKGKGVKVVIKDNSGLPPSGLNLYFTSNVPGAGSYQFLGANGAMATFTANNSATPFPISQCFPGTLGKNGAKYVLPLFSGGRLWISFSNKLVIAGTAGGGFVGPSGWAAGPGYKQPWDTVELSDNNPGIFVNLTRVDMLGLPMNLEVLPSGKSKPFSKVGEMLGKYGTILQDFVSDPPFKQLVKTVPGFSPSVPRILNPSHVSGFPNVYNSGSYYAGGYINKVIGYYKKPPKSISYNTSYKGPYCSGTWAASSNGTDFIFKQGATNSYPKSLFSSAYIFEDNPSPKYVAGTCPYLLDKILLQELNRGVAMTPTHPMEKPGQFYPKGSINNQYACILHKYSLHHATYAFAFDDAANQASAFSNPAPTQVTITIGAIPKKIPPPKNKTVVCSS